jgi:superfamily II DNA or RNA helicase
MQTKNHPEIVPTQAFLLRPYQQRAVEWAKTGADGLIIAPAGCGKTVIASSIIKHFAQVPDWTFGWLAPTRETCHQAIASLKAVGVDTSRVEVRCPHESVDFSRKKLIIVDEAKHAPADSWRRIIESCNGLRFGFDATPWSDDSERNEILRKLFRDTQFEIRRDELNGVLAHATVYMSSATDFLIQRKIDDYIEKLFTERKRYMRISQPELRAMCAWEAITEIGIVQNQQEWSGDHVRKLRRSLTHARPGTPRDPRRGVREGDRRRRTGLLQDGQEGATRGDGGVQGRQHQDHDRHLAGR